MCSSDLSPNQGHGSDPLKVNNMEEEAAERTRELGKRKKSGDWVWMPVPVLNPTLDAGLAVAVLRLYKLHPDSPASTTGLAALATSNGSWGGGLFTKNYIKQDRIRITGGIGYADLNLNFYGIGNRSVEASRLKINQRGTAGFGQVLFKLGNHLYGGIRLRYLSLTSSLRVVPEGNFDSIPTEGLLDLGLQLDSKIGRAHV